VITSGIRGKGSEIHLRIGLARDWTIL
jgi:hypothetical protein